MRVLHICESFGGGVFTVVKELANGHTACGLSVAIAFSLRQEAPANFEQQLDRGVRLYDLSRGKAAGRGGQVHIDPRNDLTIFSGVWKAIADFRPDIIHLHSSKAGFVGRLCGLLYRFIGHRTSVFYSPHGFSFLRGDVSIAARYAFLWLERLAHATGGVIVGCSEGESKVARERVGRARVATIENAVDVARIPVARHRQPKGGIPEVVTLGRLSAQKGPELFGEVARRVPPDSATFVWIGGGTPESEGTLRALPNVRVTGWLSRESALERLAGADVYLQTSHWEGMPLSVIEAMVAGLPAVVTDIVGNRDVVVSGSTGYVGGTADELAAYVNRLCTDETLRAQFGQQARHMAVRRFSLARFLVQWQQVYERAPHT